MLSPEDHAARRGRITGSLAAACLGLDPFCSPLGAYLRCIGEHPGDHEATDADDVRRRGHVLEPALVAFGAEEIARDTDCTVALDHPGTLVHPSIPWAACSIDAIAIATPGPARVSALDDLRVPEAAARTIYGLEAKAVGHAHAHTWGEPWTDQIPRHVAVQCTWELLHYPDAAAIVLPVLIGAGMELRVYVWRRSADLELACVEALGQWHARHVVRRSPPEPGQRDADLLAAVWGASGRQHPDDPRIAELVRLDHDERQIESAAKMERERVRVSIGAILQDASSCRGPWGSVTWNESRGPEQCDHAAAIAAIEARVPGAGAIAAEEIARATTRKKGRIMRTTWKGAR